MYSFEGKFVCPKCGNEKGFYVYGKSNSSEKYVSMPVSDYRPAQDWYVIDNKVKVTVKCDKCWSTNTQTYDFEGNLLV